MSVTSEPHPLNGLVLAGGRSRRMGTDKASLRYGGDPRPQWKRTAEYLGNVCPRVFVSIRQGQILEEFDPDGDFRILEDPPESEGPLTGFLEAFKADPHSGWLIVACDLPLLDEQTLEFLLANRGNCGAVAYRSANDGLPEPMCAIYEPEIKTVMETAMLNGLRCPRKILINHGARTRLIDLPNATALENGNTPEEFRRLSRQLKEVSL